MNPVFRARLAISLMRSELHFAAESIVVHCAALADDKPEVLGATTAPPRTP